MFNKKSKNKFDIFKQELKVVQQEYLIFRKSLGGITKLDINDTRWEYGYYLMAKILHLNEKTFRWSDVEIQTDTSNYCEILRNIQIPLENCLGINLFSVNKGLYAKTVRYQNLDILTLETHTIDEIDYSFEYVQSYAAQELQKRGRQYFVKLSNGDSWGNFI